MTLRSPGSRPPFLLLQSLHLLRLALSLRLLLPGLLSARLFLSLLLQSALLAFLQLLLVQALAAKLLLLLLSPVQFLPPLLLCLAFLQLLLS